jgi:hypothetical protein
MTVSSFGRCGNVFWACNELEPFQFHFAHLCSALFLGQFLQRFRVRSARLAPRYINIYCYCYGLEVYTVLSSPHTMKTSCVEVCLLLACGCPAQAEGELYKTALYDLHIELGGKVRCSSRAIVPQLCLWRRYRALTFLVWWPR